MKVKIKVGHSTSYILYSSQTLLKELEVLCSYDKLTERQKRYSNAVKNGWDGKVSLLNRMTGSFPSGLVPRIRRYLKDKNYEIEFEKDLHRSEEHPKLQTIKPLNHLRDYQKDAINQLIKYKRGMVQIPTGGGKTEAAIGCAAELKRTTIFFVPTKELLYQTRDRFQKYFPNIPIGIIGDGEIDPQLITIATVQTIYKWLQLPTKTPKESDLEFQEKLTKWDELNKKCKEFLKKFNFVIFDECHHLAADMFFTCAQNCDNAEYFLAMSATTFRDDGADLVIEAGSSEIIYSISLSKLIENGWLIPADIHIYDYPPLPPMDIGSKYNIQYDICIVNNEERNKKIRELVKKYYVEDKQILILCKELDHIDKLYNYLFNDFVFLSDDIIQVVHSKVKNRLEILEKFKNKEFPILIGSTIFDEGVDIPNLDVAILAGAGRSRVKVYQRIGRVLRTGQKEPYFGDKKATIIDFRDNMKPFYYHFLDRLSIYKNEPAFHITEHYEYKGKRNIIKDKTIKNLEMFQI